MSVPTTDEVMTRIAEVLGVAGARVRPEVALADLVAESYPLVEMAIELQDDYDVIFTQADLAAVSSVGDLVELVRSRVA
jgi:acyl carrier protein